MEIVPYVPEIEFGQTVPFVILTVAALAILALDALLDFIKGMTPKKRDTILAVVTAGSFVAAGVTFFFDILGNGGMPFLEGMFRADEFGNLGALIILFASVVFVVMSPPLIARRKLPAGELYALLVFAVIGMIMLAVANELITAFISIELLSLSLYVLAGIDRRSRRSGEAAFKYFILGAFAAAFLVFGIAFIFGATGTTQLFGDSQTELTTAALAQDIELPAHLRSYDMGMNEILITGERIAYEGVVQTEMVDGMAVDVVKSQAGAAPLNPLFLFVGFALVFVGLCFKLSLAPFHMWAPDVYEGAPTISAMFIATASKVAAFAFLIHLVEAMSYWRLFPQASGFLIAAVAAASILWGNLGALVQTNIKRMLAYSSIAHGGYITIGIAALVAPEVYASPERVTIIRNAIVFYLFAYTLLNTLAFGVVAYLGREGEGDISAYRGLGRRRPALAAAMAVAMVSLIGLGIPASIGVWGKFFVFKEAIDAGLIWLAIIGVIGSAISAYYYLNVVVAMYMKDEPSEAVAVTLSGETRAVSMKGSALVLVVTAAMTVVFGILPALFFALVK